MTILEQGQSQNDSGNATGIAKVETFGHDCTIKQISKDMTTIMEKCHLLKHQIDSVAMVMTMYGIPIPPVAPGKNSGPAPALSLAGFLQTWMPPAVPATAALAGSVTIPTSNMALATPLKADQVNAPSSCNNHNDISDQPLNPTVYVKGLLASGRQSNKLR
ncbi:hypothetical protein RSOL_239850, partial [Rhizoctonia solani AG-3 Rhs1AP]